MIVPETVNSPDTSSESPTNFDVGILGENLVADWHQSQGGTVLHRRWKCRSSELDLIVKTSDAILAFVEVKTRSQGNWDSNGLWAITPTKQQKIVTAAQLFLVKNPEFANLACRFDVALVRCRQTPKRRSQPSVAASPQTFTKIVSNYQFTLEDYLPNAFD